MSTPTEDPPFASAYIKEGRLQHVHSARCEPCMFGYHPAGQHGWAGPEDISHAVATGQPDPSNQRCACDCYDQPANEEPPPWDDDESLTDQPCDVCGESGACAYDAEGRALIHATDSKEST